MNNDDKNKGLADNHDGEFILNESGTSVSIDADHEGTIVETKTKEDNTGKETETKTTKIEEDKS